MKNLACIAVLMLLVSSPVMTADFDKGWAADKRGDYATALKEWRPLANQGNAEAQAHLGFLYEHGRGVPQNYTAAAKWYRKAANQGIATAQSNLAMMYRAGRGVTQDYAAAAKWDRKAANQGNATAQYNLGLSYIHGYGVPQDYVQAHKWSNLAAATGLKIAAKNRDIIAKKMTPAQVAEAQKLAREWFAKFEARKPK